MEIILTGAGLIRLEFHFSPPPAYVILNKLANSTKHNRCSQDSQRNLTLVLSSSCGSHRIRSKCFFFLFWFFLMYYCCSIDLNFFLLFWSCKPVTMFHLVLASIDQILSDIWCILIQLLLFCFYVQ